jgi:modulator of FtsH protease
LFVGAIVLMIAVVANIFLQMPALQLALSAAFILFSSLIIAYTINSIVHGGETNYISATLSIYISIYNIFSNLLNLLLVLTGNRN